MLSAVGRLAVHRPALLALRNASPNAIPGTSTVIRQVTLRLYAARAAASKTTASKTADSKTTKEKDTAEKPKAVKKDAATKSSSASKTTGEKRAAATKSAAAKKQSSSTQKKGASTGRKVASKASRTVTAERKKAMREKQKERERIRKEKEKEKARLQKEKEREKARLRKEKERERARLVKEKEKEKRERAREKEKVAKERAKAALERRKAREKEQKERARAKENLKKMKEKEANKFENLSWMGAIKPYLEAARIDEVPQVKSNFVAFNLFARDKLMGTGEGRAAMIERFKSAAEEWKSIPESEKLEYQARLQQIKADEEAKKIKWITSHSGKEIADMNNARKKIVSALKAKNRRIANKYLPIKDPREPAMPPMSGYSLYVRDHFGKMEGDNSAKMSQCATSYKNLPEAEKKKYETESLKLREEYNKAYEAYLQTPGVKA